MLVHEAFTVLRVGDGSEQMIGVEIEVEGIAMAHGFDLLNDISWTTTHDGSLREGGVEIISPPMSISDSVIHITQVYDWIRLNSGYPSVRTGIHVHFDMTEQTVEAMLAVCTLYALLEPVIYDALPQDREENIYCVPWYRAPDQAEILGYAYAEGKRYSRNISETCKYTGLNLGSLRQHGTLEFRMAPTFGTPQELVTWIELLNSVVSMGLSLNTPEGVMAAVGDVGLAELWSPEAAILAAKYDSYYVAECIVGGSELTWELPLLEYDPLDDNEEAVESIYDLIRHRPVVSPEWLEWGNDTRTETELGE